MYLSISGWCQNLPVVGVLTVSELRRDVDPDVVCWLWVVDVVHSHRRIML